MDLPQRRMRIFGCLKNADRFADHPGRVLDKGREVVSRPGGHRDVVEAGDEHVLGRAQPGPATDRVERPHRHQIVGAEDRLRRRFSDQGQRRGIAALIMKVPDRGLDRAKSPRFDARPKAL